MDDFARAGAFTLGEEGGFSDDPADPGGATNHGVTLDTLSSWRSHRCSVADLRGLSVAEALRIFRAGYWQPVCGDALPPGLNLLVFDFAVNAGAGTSVRELQGVLGVPADGQIGPVTLRRAESTGRLLQGHIAALAMAHAAHYRALPRFPRFGAGWLNRLARCKAAAVEMASQAVAPASFPVAGA